MKEFFDAHRFGENLYFTDPACFLHQRMILRMRREKSDLSGKITIAQPVVHINSARLAMPQVDIEYREHHGATENGSRVVGKFAQAVKAEALDSRCHFKKFSESV